MFQPDWLNQNVFCNSGDNSGLAWVEDFIRENTNISLARCVLYSSLILGWGPRWSLKVNDIKQSL